MRAADQWARMEVELGPDWDDAHLSFTPEGSTADAAAILAPLAQDGSDGSSDSTSPATGAVASGFGIFSRGSTPSVWGTLSLIESTQPMPAAGGPTPRRSSLVNAWDDAVARLAPGWSDLLCELELDSSDHLPRAALLGAPMNPTRNPEAIALRFRVSGKQGAGLAGDGPAVLRADGRRRDHGTDLAPRRALRHGERRYAGPRLAGGRTLRLELSRQRTIFADPFMPRGHADRRGSAGSRSF